MAKSVVGIDLGGTNIQAGVVTPKGAIVGRAKVKTKPESGLDGVIKRIVGAVDKACSDAGMSRSELAAIGLGAPGALDVTTGMVHDAVNLGWKNVPLRAMLVEAIGLPASIDNDANLAVYGEHRLGAGRDADDLLGVWVGTGIGGGLILGGRIFYGTLGTAGEIGHAILMPGNSRGRCSVEHTCSRSAIVSELCQLIAANNESIIPQLVGGDLSKVKSRTLAEAFKREDPLTVEVVEHAARLLGVAIGSWVTILSLGRVVIGGGLTEALGEPYVAMVRASVHDVAFPDCCKGVEIVESTLGDDAGLLGAAMLAMDQL